MNKMFFLIMLAAAAVAFFCTGCTTPYDNESDIPWNTPQAWEGTPAIPGLDGYR
jgi:hypothetical protein